MVLWHLNTDGDQTWSRWGRGKVKRGGGEPRQSPGAGVPVSWPKRGPVTEYLGPHRFPSSPVNSTDRRRGHAPPLTSSARRGCGWQRPVGARRGLGGPDGGCLPEGRTRVFTAGPGGCQHPRGTSSRLQAPPPGRRTWGYNHTPRTPERRPRTRGGDTRGAQCPRWGLGHEARPGFPGGFAGPQGRQVCATTVPRAGGEGCCQTGPCRSSRGGGQARWMQPRCLVGVAGGEAGGPGRARPWGSLEAVTGVLPRS